MIISVPHTGTQFLHRLIGPDSCHVFEPTLPEVLAKDRTHNGGIYAPLRDPAAVWQSWMRRYGSTSGIPNGNRTVSFKECWELLAEYNERYDIFFMPLDVDRDYHLQRLVDGLGISLETDWTPVGSWSHKPVPDADMKEIEWVYELPMVKNFYLGDTNVQLVNQ